MHGSIFAWGCGVFGPQSVDGTAQPSSFVTLLLIVLYFQLYIGQNININLIFLCKQYPRRYALYGVSGSFAQLQRLSLYYYYYYYYYYLLLFFITIVCCHQMVMNNLTYMCITMSPTPHQLYWHTVSLGICRNSILMMCQYPVLDSTSDWSCCL